MLSASKIACKIRAQSSMEKSSGYGRDFPCAGASHTRQFALPEKYAICASNMVWSAVRPGRNTSHGASVSAEAVYPIEDIAAAGVVNALMQGLRHVESFAIRFLAGQAAVASLAGTRLRTTRSPRPGQPAPLLQRCRARNTETHHRLRLTHPTVTIALAAATLVS